MTERDERVRAREYEAQVLSVRNSNEVIDRWKYGVALSQVGDDMTLQLLTDCLNDDLPASVRFWLSRIRKEVSQRWSKVTRDWPETWFARPGNLETFNGTIRIDGHEAPVTGLLWLVHSELPGGLSSWGGWASASRREPGEGELLLPGRRRARILVTSAQIFGGDIVFSGSGPYPDGVD
jgi:hypothetical protein